ncbi:MAG: bifunctional riboflavin kinase/FAD synthetase [Campylobacter sp.]|nr:bifunctional riboflavin kinase/FAD synthetase [Campylobacter sp.]
MLQTSVSSLCVGCFDGMHLGHQELFKRLDENGAILVIESGSSNLTPNKSRENFTNLPIFYYRLEDIRNLRPDEFINLLKREFVNLKSIVVGNDFKFGFERSGDISTLKKAFEVEVIDEFCIDGTGVHSKQIRNFLSQGDIKNANKFLGRNYSIKGAIISGQGLGKKEFVATLNLEISRYFLPKDGVYATNTLVDDKSYKSVAFIGKRVSTDGKFSIETHILDDFKECEAKDTEIFFVDFIRDNMKFSDFKALKEQILKDIEAARIKNA